MRNTIVMVPGVGGYLGSLFSEVSVLRCLITLVGIFRKLPGGLLSHKKNEIGPFVGKWMEAEIIMFSEISQPRKQLLCVLSPSRRWRTECGTNGGTTGNMEGEGKGGDGDKKEHPGMDITKLCVCMGCCNKTPLYTLYMPPKRN